jgi:hypothetical protein
VSLRALHRLAAILGFLSLGCIVAGAVGPGLVLLGVALVLWATPV